ncbi:MAG: hypothetical protein M5U34_30375 [Chloroflexi bacterium]|nr:hypothetical protein [Chloroflexota bacterium]
MTSTNARSVALPATGSITAVGGVVGIFPGRVTVGAICWITAVGKPLKSPSPRFPRPANRAAQRWRQWLPGESITSQRNQNQ